MYGMGKRCKSQTYKRNDVVVSKRTDLFCFSQYCYQSWRRWNDWIWTDGWLTSIPWPYGAWDEEPIRNVAFEFHCSWAVDWPGDVGFDNVMYESSVRGFISRVVWVAVHDKRRYRIWLIDRSIRPLPERTKKKEMDMDMDMDMDMEKKKRKKTAGRVFYDLNMEYVETRRTHIIKDPKGGAIINAAYFLTQFQCRWRRLKLTEKSGRIRIDKYVGILTCRNRSKVAELSRQIPI
ncbi:hypothetical protein XA68_16844 [Ophiocordyceps unilateralis]|uniref:Uncharacterized protein n=1 Tax=Ophiocordyceps unilateralis TaxID=268505 RepID=A0A2A9P5H9_OPHUN|nr:hypothetical protein XA68_16844 [Ophiocordyceps unilateralis]